jgi:hypothetical protein
MSRREDDLSIDDTESEESSEEESSDEDTLEEPATPLVTNQSLPEVTSQLDDLHLDMGNRDLYGRDPTPAPARVATPTRSFKVNPPTEFSGQRN